MEVFVVDHRAVNSPSLPPFSVLVAVTTAGRGLFEASSQVLRMTDSAALRFVPGSGDQTHPASRSLAARGLAY